MVVLLDSGATDAWSRSPCAGRPPQDLTVLATSLADALTLCPGRPYAVHVLGGEIDWTTRRPSGSTCWPRWRASAIDIAFVGVGGLAAEAR